MPEYTYDQEASAETSALKKEDDKYLLLETGGKILIQQGTTYTYDSKP